MQAEPLKALTLHAVWADGGICRLGKRVENRSERFAKMIAKQIGGGWLAIHAGANVGNRKGRPAACEALAALADMAQDVGWAAKSSDPCLHYGEIVDEPGAIFQRGPHLVCFRASEIATSAVVAVCRVRGVLPPGLVHPWKVTSSAALKLDDVRVLPEPVPCKGSQGLWRLPEDVRAAVVAQGVLDA